MASMCAELPQVRGGLPVARLEPKGVLEVPSRIGEFAELPSRDPAIDVGVGVYPSAANGKSELPIALAVPLVLDQKGPEVVTQTCYLRRHSNDCLPSRNVSRV